MNPLDLTPQQRDAMHLMAMQNTITNLEEKVSNLEKTRDDYIALWEKDNKTLEHNSKTLDILTKKTFFEIWLDNNKHTFKLIVAIMFSPTLLYVVAHFMSK